MSYILHGTKKHWSGKHYFTCQQVPHLTYDGWLQLGNRIRGLIMEITLPHGLMVNLGTKVTNPYDTASDGVVFVQVGDPNGICNVTGKPLPWWGRKFLLSQHMTDGEIVQTIFMATMVAMEHETREGFKYKGQSIFDPHYDIEKLATLRSQPNALIEREGA